MKLLATINRRVALRTKSVSPYCHVQFVNADDQTHPRSDVFREKGETAPFEMPMLLFGIDLSGMARRFQAASEAFLTGEVEDMSGAFDEDATKEEVKRRP